MNRDVKTKSHAMYFETHATQKRKKYIGKTLIYFKYILVSEQTKRLQSVIVNKLLQLQNNDDIIQIWYNRETQDIPY